LFSYIVYSYCLYCLFISFILFIHILYIVYSYFSYCIFIFFILFIHIFHIVYSYSLYCLFILFILIVYILYSDYGTFVIKCVSKTANGVEIQASGVNHHDTGAVKADLATKKKWEDIGIYMRIFTLELVHVA